MLVMSKDTIRALESAWASDSVPKGVLCLLLAELKHGSWMSFMHCLGGQEESWQLCSFRLQTVRHFKLRQNMQLAIAVVLL